MATYTKEEIRIRNLKKTDWHDIAKAVVANSKFKFKTDMDYEVTMKDVEDGTHPSMAYTDGNMIFVAPMAMYDDNYLLHKAMTTAMVVHESAHIAYTSTPSKSEMQRWYDKHNIKIPVELTFKLSNLFEDGRIEALASDRRDNWMQSLKAMNNNLFLKDFENNCKHQLINDNDFMGFRNAVLYFVKLKIKATPATTVYLSNSTLKDNLKEVLDLYYKHYITSDSFNSWDNLAILIKRIQDLYPEIKMTDEEVLKMMKGSAVEEGAAAAGRTLGAGGASEDTSLDPASGAGSGDLDDDEDGSSAAGAGAGAKDRDEAKEEQNQNQRLGGQKTPCDDFTINIADVNGMKSVLSPRQRAIAKSTSKDIKKLEIKAINKVANKKGNFKVKKYIKTAKQSPVVFNRKKISVNSELYMSLLIDHSGSMSGKKMDAANSAAAILEETFKYLKSDSFKIEVSAFTHYSGPYHTIIKTFGEDLPAGRSLVLASGLTAASGNADSYHIEYVTEGLKKIDKNKILVVLSDGQPAECSEGDVRKAVLKAKRNGVQVLPIFFGHFDSELEKIYQEMYDTGNNPILNAQNEEQLFEVFGQVVTMYMNQ